MMISDGESIIFETEDGSRFKVCADSECGSHGIKITALEGKLFVAQVDKDQVLVKRTK